MNKDILIFVLDENNNPVTGLVPKIRIRELGSGNLVVNNMNMSDAQDGFYLYILTGYDYTKSYSIRIDTTLEGARKWQANGIESEAEEVADAVGENLGEEVVEEIAENVAEAVEDAVDGAIESGMGSTVTEAVKTGISGAIGGPVAEF